MARHLKEKLTRAEVLEVIAELAEQDCMRDQVAYDGQPLFCEDKSHSTPPMQSGGRDCGVCSESWSNLEEHVFYELLRSPFEDGQPNCKNESGCYDEHMDCECPWCIHLKQSRPFSSHVILQLIGTIPL